MPVIERYPVGQLLRLSCRTLEISPDAVLRRCGLPDRYLAADDKGVTAEEYFKLWIAMERTYDCSDMAQRLGNAVAHGMFLPPFFAFSCSPDIKTGFLRLAQFKPLIGPFRLVNEVSDNRFSIAIKPLDPTLVIPASLALTEMIMMLELMRTHTCFHVIPLEVALPRPDEARFFGCKPVQGSIPSLSLSLEDAQRPLISENKEMWSVFEPSLRRQLADRLAESGTSERLRNALLKSIPSGETNVVEVAAKMHLSKRTLQRKLNDEGTSFQKVLDETRADLARHYLGRTSISLDEVSYLLGYTNAASFFRASQSWFGTTPSEFRRTHIDAFSSTSGNRHSQLHMAE